MKEVDQIGLTSHIADIMRKAGKPSRLDNSQIPNHNNTAEIKYHKLAQNSSLCALANGIYTRTER
jgi:hypothetical protein